MLAITSQDCAGAVGSDRREGPAGRKDFALQLSIRFAEFRTLAYKRPRRGYIRQWYDAFDFALTTCVCFG